MPAARIIAVGEAQLKGGRGVQQAESDPKEVVPVTFALTPKQQLRVTEAESLLRGGPARAAAPRRQHAAEEGRDDLRAARPQMTQHRLLLAIADAELAQSASALAGEGEELQVVDRVSDAEELARALRRLEVDVVVLHDALGAVPVLDVARDIASSFPEVGLVLIAADDSPEMFRAAMQAGLRDVVSLPLSLEQLEGSVRAASQWSRTMRDRVAGEESAGAALGGQLIAVAGSKGGVGTTTVCLQLALAAVRAAPGRPVCLVDFDLQKGDFRSFLDMPYRRSVVDLVEVADEISVRHLQETLYTHKEGFRVLLAPDDGERAEEVNALAARPILSAVKARHALTIVDLGATVSEASAIGAEIANRVLVVTQPDVVSLRGVKRLLDLWKRLQVREDDEDVLVVLNRASRKLEVQPDLARKVDRRQARQDDDPRRLLRLRGRREYGYTGTYGGREAARELRQPARRGRRAAGVGRGARHGPVGAARPAGPARRRARPGQRRDDGPAAGARARGARAVAGRAARLHVPARRPRGARGRARARGQHGRHQEGQAVPRRGRGGPAEGVAQGREDRDRQGRSGDGQRRACVPVVLPGLNSPFKVSDHASTSVEDEPLPDSQVPTPVPSKKDNDVMRRAAGRRVGPGVRGADGDAVLAAAGDRHRVAGLRSPRGPTRRSPTPRAPPAASRAAAATPRRPLKNALSTPLQKTIEKIKIDGDKATVKVRMPLLHPRAADQRPADRHPLRGAAFLMGLRDRIAGEAAVAAPTTTTATASPTTASGCSRRSTSPRSPSCPRRSAARASSASSGAWSRARARCSRPPSARG